MNGLCVVCVNDVNHYLSTDNIEGVDDLPYITTTDLNKAMLFGAVWAWVTLKDLETKYKECSFYIFNFSRLCLLKNNKETEFNKIFINKILDKTKSNITRYISTNKLSEDHFNNKTLEKFQYIVIVRDVIGNMEKFNVEFSSMVQVFNNLPDVCINSYFIENKVSLINFKLITNSEIFLIYDRFRQMFLYEKDNDCNLNPLENIAIYDGTKE